MKLLYITNKIDDVDNIKMQKGWDFEVDVETKLTDLYFNGTALHSYIINNSKIDRYVKSPNLETEIANAKIMYRDLRTGSVITIEPSIFKQKIKPLTQYDKINNFIRIKASDLPTSSEEIAESAYHALFNKF